MKKVCAIFPLLPDPGDFISRVKNRFPDAEISLYTANEEAAKRAESCGAKRAVYRNMNEFALTAPKESKMSAAAKPKAAILVLFIAILLVPGVHRVQFFLHTRSCMYGITLLVDAALDVVFAMLTVCEWLPTEPDVKGPMLTL